MTDEQINNTPQKYIRVGPELKPLIDNIEARLRHAADGFRAILGESVPVGYDFGNSTIARLAREHLDALTKVEDDDSTGAGR